MTSSGYCISAADVESARVRIRGHVHETPLLTCSALNFLASSGAVEPRSAYFKCELFQKSGSFKARGACSAVMSLAAEEASKGVCTHSSGNHAAALAVAAQIRGIAAHIVMPSDAPAVKREAVVGYGGIIIECAPTQSAREAAAADVQARTGARFVHPSEDPLVIAGQGTLGLELLEQAASLQALAGSGSAAAPSDEPPLDAVIIPVGGGGMLSGVATAIRGRFGDRIRIIAAEPAGADDAYRSKAAGERQGHAAGGPKTIADGLKTTLGPNTWPIVRDCVERVVRVSEDDIVAAMRLVYTRMKLAIEPSAAVGVAALLSDEVKALPGLRRIGVVLCGGNVDIDKLPWMGAGSA